MLIWYVYPNIGIDDRNQFDARARPARRARRPARRGRRTFHRRGVKVFLPTMPWDNGTRREGEPDWEADRASSSRRVGADGINGDTYNGVPRAFFDACERARSSGRAAAGVDRTPTSS